jgi:ribonuclease BN (tRNA processing enzyme)
VRTEHEGRTWSVVLDLGNGALGALQRHMEPRAVDAVLLSHLHVDHCIDVCGLYVMMRYGPRAPATPAAPGAPGPAGARPTMPVWGPPGTGRQLARAYGGGEGEDVLGVFDFRDLRDREPVTVGPFTITPVRVNHPVEAYGFRVEAGGRVLAYTGDTDLCEGLDDLMTGADLVLADSAFVDGRDSVPDIHLSGRRAAEAAVRAGGVGRLMLTHIPAWNDPEVCRGQAAAVWPGDVELAEADATYRL